MEGGGERGGRRRKMLKKGRIKISLGKPKEGKRRNEQKKKKTKRNT